MVIVYHLYYIAIHSHNDYQLLLLEKFEKIFRFVSGEQVNYVLKHNAEANSLSVSEAQTNKNIVRNPVQ